MINYGDQEHNPLERFLFYSKDAEGSFVMRSNHISTMLPRNFQVFLNLLLVKYFYFIVD